ncbi:TIR domain-containing protein [Dyella soli]|uniref:Toll/interleukin-1 receptor domain-containing protein n=1 Tax=Dyella soli TaxID=522319 RepID=A0A4R0YQA2_9GAMM|nr:toll/interleukin-1 receptor domain-containing protein [Dyella soli]TCI06991.1 toll/interleukin-1 receptor domain-containing protein [Dyella soli]
MSQEPIVPVFRYRAFISYSHQDKSWADWLHKALETYAIPARLVGQTTAAGVVPRRLAPVFRDRDELASATDLGRKVNEALAASANLVVICSPRSAASRWVNEEVLAFKRLGRSEHIFCLIVDGEPGASGLPGREAEECFATALRHRMGADGQLSAETTEPIAADARPGKDGRTHAKLKLIAGMLDLGFDQLRQREQQRHQRRLAMVTALAVAVTVVTSTLAVVAVQARRVAERERNQAEGLVGFMLGDLNDKVRQVQRLDIMEAVDDRAMAYFKSLPSTDVTDTSLQQRAKALEKIGSVRLDQGHLDAARESYQAAATLAGPLAARAPADLSRQVAYSRVIAFMGMTEWFRGNLDAAEKNFTQAQDVLRRAPRQAKADPDLTQQWATVDNDLGHVLEAHGKLDQAATQYGNMLGHCRELVSGADAKTEWQELLGEAHNNLGKMALMRGDLATAIAEYRADDAIETAMSERDPKDHDQRENMVRVRAILGRTLALGGQVQAGADHLQQAIDGATQLSQFEPKSTSFRAKVALYSTQLARLRRLTGELDAARQLSASARDIFGDMTRQDPSNAEWQQGDAEARLEQAAQFHAAGQTAEAHAAGTQALAVLAPLQAKQPDERTLLLDTANARLLLANTTADARLAEQWRTAVLKDITSVTSGGGDPRLLALRVEALLGLDRQADAEPLIRQLWASGYRDLHLVAALAHDGIAYPANLAFQQHLQDTVAGGHR